MFRSQSDPALHQAPPLIARRISARKRRESIVTDGLETQARFSGLAGDVDRSELLESLEEHSATTDGMVALHQAIERPKPDPWQYMGQKPSQDVPTAGYHTVDGASPELLSRPSFQQAPHQNTFLQTTSIVPNEIQFKIPNIDETLPEILSEPICIITPEGRVVYLSSAFYLMQPQLQSGDYEVKSFLEFLHPYDEAPLVAGLREVMQNGNGDFVLRLFHHALSYEWFDFHGRLMIEQDEKHILLHGRRRDPLERPLMQYLIHDQNQHISPQIWVHLSRSGVILYATSMARSVFGLSDDPNACHSLSELYKTPAKERLLDILSRIGVSDRSICMDHDVRTRGGHSHKAHSMITMTAQRTLIAFVRLAKRGDGSHRPFKLHSWTDGTGESSVSGFSGDGPGSSNEDSGCVCTSGGNSMALDTPQGTGKQPDEDWMHPSSSPPALVAVYKLQQENRLLTEELQELEQRRRKQQKKIQSRARGTKLGGCRMCHSTETPEWRRGPSGQRDLCNRCGLRWAKDQKERRKREAEDSGVEE